MRLLSLMIALFILMIATMMMSASYRNMLLMSQDSRINDNAQIAADEKLYELKAQTSPPLTGIDSLTVDKFKFERSWVITDTGKVPKATITITWMALNKSPRTCTFTRGI